MSRVMDTGPYLIDGVTSKEEYDIFVLRRSTDVEGTRNSEKNLTIVARNRSVHATLYDYPTQTVSADSNGGN